VYTNPEQPTIDDGDLLPSWRLASTAVLRFWSEVSAMDADHVAPRTRTRPDLPGSPGSGKENTLLRAEALRQLRWHQRKWARILAAHAPGTPVLIASADPAGFTDGLDLLREAGEDVPSWLSHRGSLVRTTEVASDTTRVSLTDLLADITQALAWFDPEPSASVQTARPCFVTDAAAARSQTAATATMNTTESRDAAAGDWSIGDRVTAAANALTVAAGSRGTVVGFSGAGGHPLVDFAGAGLVLIRADHLGRDGDVPPEARFSDRPRSSGTIRLSATPRPPPGETVPAPPPPDWFDRQPPLQR
jgi:hypothetical protein